MRKFEESNIYFPSKVIEVTPDAIGLNFEDVWLTTSDGIRLHSWFIKGGDQTILFCHGNAGNIGDRMDKIKILHDIGFNLFIFDYRGYGQSESKPSEEGLYKDVDSAYAYLTNTREISSDSIILYGESLGGAVAIDLAHRVSAGALITENTFTSIKDMAKTIYPFLPTFLIRTKFDSESKIKHIDIPKLIIHSLDDQMIPYEMGKKLFESAKEPKRFLEINGAHNAAVIDSKIKVQERIRSFLKEELER
ncbi:alpha/beta hydrolase [Candidatus Omnitrophota bacterium]